MTWMFAVPSPESWKIWLHVLPQAGFVPQLGEIELDIRFFLQGVFVARHTVGDLHLGRADTITIHSRIPQTATKKRCIGVEFNFSAKSYSYDLSSSCFMVEMAGAKGSVKFTPQAVNVTRESISTRDPAVGMPSALEEIRTSLLLVNGSEHEVQLQGSGGLNNLRGSTTGLGPLDVIEVRLPALRRSDEGRRRLMQHELVDLLREERVVVYRLDRHRASGQIVSVVSL